MTKWLKYSWLLLALFCSGRAVAAQEAIQCVVCGKKITEGSYWYYDLKTTGKRVYICSDCKKLKQNCAICGLPVKEDAARTPDGRYICPLDFPNVALDDTEIRTTFGHVAGELINMTMGKMELRSPKVNVGVYDLDYWNADDNRKTTSGMQRHGMSQSRPIGNGFAHSALLYRGLFKDELVAVCAHEYTHLWINENKPASHQIEKDTVESICEVVAFALMEKLENNKQMTNILDNTYTKGCITTAVKYYRVHGLGGVLDWVKEGTGATLKEEDFQAMAAGSTAAALVWGNSGVAYHVKYEKLKLKGIVGGGDKRTALINGKTFMKGETRKVEVNGKKVSIQIQEIKDASVLVLVEGEDKPQELFLE